MTERVYNFSAGPAVLPVEVLEEAKENLLSLGKTGVGMKELAFYYFADDATKLWTDAGASDTWAFKAPFVDRDGVFYGYGNDQNRGFDIYKVDLSSSAGQSASPGVWLSPAEALAMTEALGDEPPGKPFCLLGDR